jgi:hypothetical protein
MCPETLLAVLLVALAAFAMYLTGLPAAVVYAARRPPARMCGLLAYGAVHCIECHQVIGGVYIRRVCRDGRHIAMRHDDCASSVWGDRDDSIERSDSD